MLKKISLIAISTFMLQACYYNNEVELYPEGKSKPCDTTSVSFANSVLPILNSDCNVCHGSGIAQGSVILDNYSDIILYVNDGSLLGSIQHNGQFSDMPKGGNKLSECKINTIMAWISQGNINN